MTDNNDPVWTIIAIVAGVLALVGIACWISVSLIDFRRRRGAAERRRR